MRWTISMLKVVDREGIAQVVSTLKIHHYRNYILGHFLANIGVYVQRILLGWLVWQQTNSPFWLGLVLGIEFVSFSVVSIFAGPIIDRSDYLKMVKVTQSLATLHSLLLFLVVGLGYGDALVLISLMFIRGAITAFNRTSRSTLLHHLVPDELLHTAIATNALILNGTKFIAPASATALIAASNMSIGFLFTAVSHVIFVALLQRIKITIPSSSSARQRTFLQDFAEGFAFIKTNRSLLNVFLRLLLGAVALRPVSDMLPAVSDLLGNDGFGGLALLYVASALGATLMGVWFAQRSLDIEQSLRLLYWNEWLIAAGLMALAASDSYNMGLILIVITSGVAATQSIIGQSFIQRVAEPSVRGRILAIHGLVNRTVPAIGLLLFSALADLIGLRIALCIGGGITFLLCMLHAFRRCSDEIKPQNE